MAKRPEEDFDINSIVKLDEHQKLLSRVQELEKKEYFVETFCTASKEYVKVQKCLNDVFISLIQKDSQCRDELKKLIAETDKRTFKNILSKAGMWVLAGITFILGLFTQAIINRILPPNSP